jgi:hypothetical protein
MNTTTAPTDITQKQLYTAFFEPLTNMLLSDGGDGSAVIITRYAPAKLVADWYDEWQSSKKWKLAREDHEDGHVSFWDNQEGLVILDGTRGELSDQELDVLRVSYRFGDYAVII